MAIGRHPPVTGAREARPPRIATRVTGGAISTRTQPQEAGRPEREDVGRERRGIEGREGVVSGSTPLASHEDDAHGEQRDAEVRAERRAGGR